MRDPIDKPVTMYFRALVIGITYLVAVWCFFDVVLSYAVASNGTEENDSFELYMENMSSEHTDIYKNVTILDKEHRERSFRSDVYNIVYKTEDGNLSKTNDMELYYAVEEGHNYNVSWNYGIEDVIEEV